MAPIPPDSSNHLNLLLLTVPQIYPIQYHCLFTFIYSASWLLFTHSVPHFFLSELFFNKLILLIYFWLYWVFIAACRLSLVVVSVRVLSSCSARTSYCGGFSCFRALAEGQVGSVVATRGLYSTSSVVVVHELSCPMVCGIFPNQGSNPCPLHWQAKS